MGYDRSPHYGGPPVTRWTWVRVALAAVAGLLLWWLLR